MSAIEDIAAERARQIAAEGWTPEHDDEHDGGDLAKAAAAYALWSASPTRNARGFALPTCWPWSPHWWKPKNPRTDLVRAGALIVAEIERLDRLALESHP